jgi:UDP-N-acetyl-D-glucosamine dehydrogenase
MPDYVVSRIGEALNEAGRAINGSRILAVGASYKAGVDDQRESPALAVMSKLMRKGAELTYHDPFLPDVEVRGTVLKSVDLDPEVVAAQDCVVILTAHQGVDHRALVRSAQLLFDARGVTVGIEAPNVVRL